jgi:hypothetical protein
LENAITGLLCSKECKMDFILIKYFIYMNYPFSYWNLFILLQQEKIKTIDLLLSFGYGKHGSEHFNFTNLLYEIINDYLEYCLFDDKTEKEFQRYVKIACDVDDFDIHDPEFVERLQIARGKVH